VIAAVTRLRKPRQLPLPITVVALLTLFLAVLILLGV